MRIITFATILFLGTLTVSSAAFCQSYAPVASYELEDFCTTNQVLDSSGNEKDGNSSRPTKQMSVLGKDGNAFKFNGAGDYIDFGTNNRIADFGGEDGTTTIMAWVRPSDSTGYNCVFRGFGGLGYVSVGAPGLPGKIVIMVRDVVNKQWNWLYSGTRVPEDEWTHIAVVFEGGVGLKLYINGMLDGPGSDPDNTNLGLFDYGSNSYVGQGFDDYSFFTGDIDSVQVFDRAISRWELRAKLWSPDAYGMEIESTVENPTSVTVTTTGAMYVFGEDTIEMWRRIDPGTNTIAPLQVAELDFAHPFGPLTVHGASSSTAVYLVGPDFIFLVRSDGLLSVTVTSQ